MVSIDLLRYPPKINENVCPHKDLHVNVHSTVIHNSPKVETIQMSISWGGDKYCKRRHIHTMEDSAAIKRNKQIIYSTTWMNRKDITLSEISQTQMTAYCTVL